MEICLESFKSLLPSFLRMGITFVISSLSGKIPCDNDRPKTRFSGIANSSKHRLITLALMSSITRIFYDLRKKDNFL